ncbi:uncharacterized protein isoform X2 [Leptinotarsa decemlineata]|uniref:uncharacterized protein isoform X2 n=2 Tax=Leptinotarsa decemlineata TaxID=7539 RepID=UPI003D304E13
MSTVEDDSVPWQTLSNTKISDRAHALHITSKEWGKINKHLDRKKLIQEAIEKEENKKKYLDEGSKSMIRNWENSLENIRKRKEDERLQQIEQKKEDRNQKFFALRKEQEKIRKDYVDKMKKQIFMNTGNARELTSAFVTSEILYEREKQKNFKNSIKERNEKLEAEFAETVKKNAEDELREKKEKEEKLYKKNKEHGEHLKKIIEERTNREQKEKEKKIMKEAMDNIRAVEEMECMEKKLMEKKLEDKVLLNRDNKKLLKLEEEKRTQIMKEEKELDDVVAIYQEAKHRIDCMKKAREKELQEERVARRDAVAKLVVAEEKARHEGDEERMKAAIAERDAIEEAKVKARADFDRRMKEERIEDRKHFIEREASAKAKEEEIRKWEMLNRYKTDEIIKNYEETKRKEYWEKILKYRKELLEQMDEEKALKIEEKEIDQYVTKMNYVNEDDKFFEYADEILHLAKKKGRSTYPIEKAIMQYKKINQLHPNEERGLCDEYKPGKGSGYNSKEIIKQSMNSRNCRCQLQRNCHKGNQQ